MEREFEHRLTEVEARSKSNVHRLDEIERRVGVLESQSATVAVLAERMKNVETNVEEIKGDVKSIKGKPGKRWESLVSQIITLLVAAIAGFILAKLGL
ncbi:MAG: hypothetical protein IJY93_04195 [Clostridia bacterium]|nr:hypothetical protein [Clostridia bacterium]